ncbi:MAG: biopolymer transporter ExbD [Gammaproteobacteria bacterium]|jgi:biopolymer transport protein ExbD
MRSPVTDSAAPETQSDIDLTPMLDVVFIMLIFFLVVASFIKEDGLDVNQSAASLVSPATAENILISIEEDNLIWIGERPIDPQAIRANIKRMVAENPAATVVIKVDRHSANKTLVQVMDASRQAGIYRIFLAAQHD